MCVKIFRFSTVFTSDNQHPEIPYFRLLTNMNVQLKPQFLKKHCINPI